MAPLPQERLVLPSPKLDETIRIRYLEQRLTELQRALSLFFVEKGDPFNVVDAPKGAIFLRVDGTADAPVYLNVTGGKTGWFPLHPVLHGTVTIADTNTFGTVTLSQAMPDTSYLVIASIGVLSSGTLVLGANRIKSITVSSTTQFVLTIETAPGSGQSVTFNYIAIR